MGFIYSCFLTSTVTVVQCNYPELRILNQLRTIATITKGFEYNENAKKQTKWHLNGSTMAKQQKHDSGVRVWLSLLTNFLLWLHIIVAFCLVFWNSSISTCIYICVFTVKWLLQQRVTDICCPWVYCSFPKDENYYGLCVNHNKKFWKIYTDLSESNVSPEKPRSHDQGNGHRCQFNWKWRIGTWVCYQLFDRVIFIYW